MKQIITIVTLILTGLFLTGCSDTIKSMDYIETEFEYNTFEEQSIEYNDAELYSSEIGVDVSYYADIYFPKNDSLSNVVMELYRFIFKYDGGYSMGTTWCNTSNYDNTQETSTIIVYHKNNNDDDTLYTKVVNVHHITSPYAAAFIVVDKTVVLLSSYQYDCDVEEYILAALGYVFPQSQLFTVLSENIILDSYCYNLYSTLYIEQFAIDLYVIVKDIIITVNEEYTYKFFADGELYYSETLVEDSIPTKPTDPTKEDYIFIGWEVHGTIYNFDYPLNENQTLTAVWEEENPIYFTVTFDSDGGTNVNSQEIKQGELSYYSSLKPQKDNYVFQYWSLDGKEFNFDTPITEDITLVAIWEEYTGPPYINTESLSEGYQILNEIYYTEHYSIERVLKTVADYLLVKDNQKVFLYYSEIKPFITLDNGVVTYKAYLNNELLVEGTINLYLIENSNLPFIALNNSDFHFTHILTNVSNIGITMDEIFKVYSGTKTEITYKSSMFNSTTIESPKGSDIFTSLLLNECYYSTTISLSVLYFNNDTIKSDIKIFNTNNLKSTSTNYEGVIIGEIYTDNDYIDTSDELKDYTLTNSIYYTENNTAEDAFKLATKYMLYYNGKLVENTDEFNFEFRLESDGKYYAYVYRGDELIVSGVGYMTKVINTKLNFISTYNTSTHIYTIITLTQPSGYTADDYFHAYSTLFPYITNFYQDFNLQNLTKETVVTNTSIYRFNSKNYSYRTNFIVIDDFNTDLNATYEIGVIGEFNFESLDYAESKTMASTFVAEPEEDKNFIENIIETIQNNIILQLITTSIAVIVLIGLAYLIFILFRNIYEWFIY
ncbi:MAG: InlB B-repeat-containing protein [bacterium]